MFLSLGHKDEKGISFRTGPICKSLTVAKLNINLLFVCFYNLISFRIPEFQQLLDVLGGHADRAHCGHVHDDVVAVAAFASDLRLLRRDAMRGVRGQVGKVVVVLQHVKLLGLQMIDQVLIVLHNTSFL